jgi:outer membrane murein-binding lipoprotein Lpp
MKKWIAGLTALLFVLGMGLWEIGVQAGSGHYPSGVLLAKKDKEKEEKGLKEKEEQLESKAKELNAKEEALKKKEEALKKWEDTLKQQSKRARRRSQQGAGAGLQQPPGAPAGFSPRTTNPQTMPQPNMAAPKSPQAPATATPPKQ